MAAAADGLPFTLVDLDPDGVHADLGGILAGEGASALVAAGDALDASHLRAAAIPHPHLGALVPAPRGAGVDGCDLAARLAALDDRPRLLIDCGSGTGAARRVDASTPCILVVTRDAPGLRAAENTRAALPNAPAVLVINDGCRRADVGHRAAARVVGVSEWLELGTHERDAQRVAVGVLPGKRSRVGALARDLATRCGFGPTMEGGDA